MKQTDLPKEFFVNNRRNLLNKLPENSISIVCANIQYPKNGDQHFNFRQDSDFFYLTGLEVPDCLLVLVKDNQQTNQMLFIKETNEKIMLWDGPRPDKEMAAKISGVNQIHWLADFDKWITMQDFTTTSLYMNVSAGYRSQTVLPTAAQALYNKYISTFANTKATEICQYIHELRLVKSTEEIEILKKAIDITKQSYLEILQWVNGQKTENQIDAKLRFEMQNRGAHDLSFAPIIASGKNACILHYINNDENCKSGDLLLMDFGADYSNYAADCSRTIPLNGKYSKRQAQLYNACLDVYYQAKTFFVPGACINEVNAKTEAAMQEKLQEIGLLTCEDIRNQDPKNPALKKYFPHGTTHFIGLDVHDVGGKDVKFKAGMVLSCEPGIYIKNEGIGIRIETDMLITNDGAIDLMEDFPVTIYEIEKAMQ